MSLSLFNFLKISKIIFKEESSRLGDLGPERRPDSSAMLVPRPFALDFSKLFVEVVNVAYTEGGNNGPAI